MCEVLTFPIPDTLNKQLNAARSNRFAAATAKKELTQKVASWAKGRAITRFKGAVWISVTWQLSSFANDPLDNLPAGLKCILDGLVKAAVLKKDSAMIIQSPIVHFIERGENKVAIEISDKPIWRLERIDASR